MTAAARRWVERTPLAPEGDEVLLAELRRLLPGYSFDVVPALLVSAAGGRGARAVSLEMDEGTTVEDLVGRIRATLESP